MLDIKSWKDRHILRNKKKVYQIINRNSKNKFIKIALPYLDHIPLSVLLHPW